MIRPTDGTSGGGTSTLKSPAYVYHLDRPQPLDAEAKVLKVVLTSLPGGTTPGVRVITYLSTPPLRGPPASGRYVFHRANPVIEDLPKHLGGLDEVFSLASSLDQALDTRFEVKVYLSAPSTLPLTYETVMTYDIPRLIDGLVSKGLVETRPGKLWSSTHPLRVKALDPRVASLFPDGETKIEADFLLTPGGLPVFEALSRLVST